MDSDRQTEVDRFEPSEWFVVFHRESDRPIFRFLSFGRYRHVSAFGYLPHLHAWVFFSFLTGRIRIATIPDHQANRMLEFYSKRGCILRMPAPDPKDRRFKAKPVFTCVQAVAHLLGLSTCALRPDALHRHCLANGGTIIVGDDDALSRRSGNEGPGAAL